MSNITRIATFTILFVAQATVARLVLADAVGYQAVVNLRAEGNDFVVEHHHDWSGTTHDSRYRMITTHQDPFRDDNDYAYIAWYKKEGHELVRRLPCPALTWLRVSEDSRFVI